MTLLHNNILVKELPAETQQGLLTLKTPEKKYEVLQCGPKALVVKPGDMIKPFTYCKGRPFEGNFIFNTDEIDDIVLRA